MKALPNPNGNAEDLLDGERVERSQQLLPGRYWKAKAAIKDGDRIPKGCVMLLQRIKRVDEKPHSVEVAGHPLLHPDSTFTFFVHEFLNAFEPEPRGAEVRAEELAALRAKVDEQQRELLTVTTNPAALLEELRRNPTLPKPETRSEEKAGLPTAPFDFAAGLPGADFRPGTTIAELAGGVDKEGQSLLRRQAENQAIAAKKRAEMISARTTAIANTVAKMTPFYEEMGAVALAQSQDALDIYKKLKSGLATLGLYTGTDVELFEVRRGGESAPADEPIHIFQAVLFMDEESLIRVEEGGAECGDFETFLKLLGEDDALLDRLLPVRRGVCAMRYTHEMKERPGMDALTAARIEDANRKCFLVIRNGDRVHVARSETLAKIKRLFPSQSDFDRPFDRSDRWRGIESERITVEDLQFVEAREKLDDIVLHYRRILIMIAGLIDREPRVFGDVAALTGKTGLSLLSLAVQEAAFRPVSDEENALATGRPDFWKWIAEKNEVAQSGSRLICFWKKLMTTETCPYAVRSQHGQHAYDYFLYNPDEDFSIVIARREGQSIVVDAPVHGGRGVDRNFNARVDVTKFGDRGGLGYLCLDALDPSEIEHYLRRREGRSGYIKYVRLLLAAKAAVAADLAHEKNLRRELVDALQAGEVRFQGAEESEAVSSVIRQWRAARRGQPTRSRAAADYMTMFRALLDQLWVLAGRGRDRKAAAEGLARVEGTRPLRLSLSGRTRLYLYTTSAEAEVENLLDEHPWVTRLTLEELKTKVTVVDRRQVLLPASDPKETVLAEWPGVEEWTDRVVSHRLSRDQVRALRDLGPLGLARAERWLGPRDAETFKQDLVAVKIDSDDRSKKYVRNGSVLIPLVICRATRKETEWDHETRKNTVTKSHRFYLGGVAVETVDALYINGTPGQRKAVREWVRSQYRDPTSALEGLGKKVAHFFTCRVEQAIDLGRPGASLTDGSIAIRSIPAGKTWAKDLAEFVKQVKDRVDYRSNDSAEVVLRFDETAEVVYRLLRGHVSRETSA